MEKIGVNKDILYEDLRNEEAMLMRKVQNAMLDKTASEDFHSSEIRLQQVRNKLTELDLKGTENLVQDL